MSSNVIWKSALAYVSYPGALAPWSSTAAHAKQKPLACENVKNGRAPAATVAAAHCLGDCAVFVIRRPQPWSFTSTLAEGSLAA